MIDSDCSHMCELWGLCHAERGACRARQNDDCEGSSTCRDQGFCIASGGGCWTMRDIEQQRWSSDTESFRVERLRALDRHVAGLE